MTAILAAVAAGPPGTASGVSAADAHPYHFVAGGTASARYRLNNSGTAESTVNGNYVALSGQWLVAGSASAFEARMTLVSGAALTSGPTGWNALSTTRTWTLVTTGSDAESVNTLEIRRASDSLLLVTATITFSALGAA